MSPPIYFVYIELLVSSFLFICIFCFYLFCFVCIFFIYFYLFHFVCIFFLFLFISFVCIFFLFLFISFVCIFFCDFTLLHRLICIFLDHFDQFRLINSKPFRFLQKTFYVFIIKFRFAAFSDCLLCTTCYKHTDTSFFV